VRGAEVTRLRRSDVARFGDLGSASARHHAPPELLQWLRAEGLEARSLRSGASGKYLLLSQGDLDAVVTVTGGEKEWDSARGGDRARGRRRR
jgi:3'-phosphoadenosine 5'-phosphosulfate (PAPS) 3'-phosphatase